MCRISCFRWDGVLKQPFRCSHLNLVKEYLSPVCHLWELSSWTYLFSQGRFARSRRLPLLGSPAISLEPWTATTRTTSITMDSLATVAVASVTSTWPVLLTRPLDQDSGSQNTRCFVQQKAVASRVSGGEKMIPWQTAIHRCCQLAKLPGQLPSQHGKDRDDSSGEWESIEARVHQFWCLSLFKLCLRPCQDNRWGRENLDGQELWLLHKFSNFVQLLRAASHREQHQHRGDLLPHRCQAYKARLETQMDSGDTRSEDSPCYNLLNLHCRIPYFAASKREGKMGRRDGRGDWWQQEGIIVHMFIHAYFHDCVFVLLTISFIRVCPCFLPWQPLHKSGSKKLQIQDFSCQRTLLLRPMRRFRLAEPWLCP